MKLECVLSVALGLAMASPASAGEIKERTTYFMVKGSTLAELDRAFGQTGPLLGSGERRGGATDVAFDGHVTYETAGGRCGVDRVNYRLNLHTTLPKWSAPAGASPEAGILWRTLRNDIATHESRHAAIAKTWLQRIESRIKALPPQVDCTRMEQRVNAEQRMLLRQHDQAQVEFDRREAGRIDARLKHQLARNMGRFTLR